MLHLDDEQKNIVLIRQNHEKIERKIKYTWKPII